MWGEAVERTRRLVRRQEVKAQESQDRLDDILAALQASPNGVVLLDKEGRIEWCNAMAAAHLVSMPGATSCNPSGIWCAIRSSVRTTLRRISLRMWSFEGRGGTPSRPVRISVQLHPYGDGRSLLLSRDVTALEQADAMRRDFVANVSHEIRTPLTVLMGFVETLQTLPLVAQGVRGI